MSPGTAVRELQRAQSLLRKARQALRQVRGGSASPEARDKTFAAGWAALAEMHRILGTIPVAAASAGEDVMTRQLAVERYGTALLVRLRRLQRNELTANDPDDTDSDDDV
jgi:hypothetical protein